MKIIFDTEFIEDGKTIDLISIGMVREDGTEYYAESLDCDTSKANQWVIDNVFPSLNPDRSAHKNRWEIKRDILGFVGEKPEFWAWYADYDWVVLCQLYGRMIDLPNGWPMYCRDFKQWCDEHKVRLHQHDSNHNALEDARWLAEEMGRFNV